MDQLTLRTHQRVDNPLQRFLLFLTSMPRRSTGWKSCTPGCLVTSIVYQDQVFDREIQPAYGVA